MDYQYSTRARRILQLVEEHEQYRGTQCINLRADENCALPAAKQLMSCDMLNRNTSPDPHFKYRGTDFMVEMAAVVDELARETFRAKHVVCNCPTGHTANILVFMALCQPGDTVMTMNPAAGGYSGTSAGKLPTYLGLNVCSFPFDFNKMNIDEEATIQTVLREKPRLVIFGATYFLFPQPVRRIAEAVHSYGGIVAFDAAHVLGLIVGGQFQDPLREGADVLFGSTMKSFAGVPGGLVATDSDEIYEKLINASDYVAVTAVQWNRIPALGITFDWLLSCGREYAARVVANSRKLAKELVCRDIPVMFKELGYTRSHMILLDVGGMEQNVAGKASVYSERLEKCNLIIDDRGRIGTSEVSRLGMGPSEMAEVAELIRRAMDGGDPAGICRDVASLRARFN